MRRRRESQRVLISSAPALCAACVVIGLCACSCGGVPLAGPPKLFTVPLAIEGTSIGSALLDTGGGYELMLRDHFGLEVIDTVEVLAFTGRESVDLVGGFNYRAGDVQTVADAAIVGVSVCDCNGVGYRFFRKTGVVLGIDFTRDVAGFFMRVPEQGISLAFAETPDYMSTFDSVFVDLEVALPDRTVRVPALVDTGASGTLIAAELLAEVFDAGDRVAVTLHHEDLGTVAVRAQVFDNPELPQVIVGTDVMPLWADRWYFSFAPVGGNVTLSLPR